MGFNEKQMTSETEHMTWGLQSEKDQNNISPQPLGPNLSRLIHFPFIVRRTCLCLGMHLLTEFVLSV